MTLAERLRTALAAPSSGDLIVGEIEPDDTIVRADAAVLVAITDRPEPGVILTQRTESLRRHAGQVAFPGGRVDPGDADVAAAALREAEEEIGLPRDVPELVGTADGFRTHTGFDIAPVIAVIPPDLPLSPHEAEVAAIFEVPLAWLLDPANHRLRTVMFQGRSRDIYEMPWEDRHIWGITAAMIVNLSRRLGSFA